ncbi:unnamed protein product, partial [Urochloa humidicola]
RLRKAHSGGDRARDQKKGGRMRLSFPLVAGAVLIVQMFTLYKIKLFPNANNCCWVM